ncbi:MAG: hypothetical protein ACE5H9_06205 [Anaerolineae bacterium]
MTTDFDTDFSDGFQEPPSGGGNNRLFIIIALGLVGLLVLGLIGIGSVVALRRLRSAQEVALATPTPTEVAVLQPSPTATFTPLPPTPTSTTVPTPTNTPVLAPGNGGEEGATPAASPTRTPVPLATPVSGGEVPDTGIGGFGAALIGTGLAGLFFVARRLRRSG